MTFLRTLLATVVLCLVLPQITLAQSTSTANEQNEATEVPSPRAETADTADTADKETGTNEWWTLHPRPSDGWRLGLQSLVRIHMNSWAIPVAIVGGFGLTSAMVGVGMAISSPFNEPIPLILGLPTLGITAAMAGAAFPTLAAISRALDRIDDPTRLHQFLKRTRKTLGIISVVFGATGLAAGLLAPLTFGVSGIPSAALTTAGVMLGQASLTFLVFETKVGRFVSPRSSPNRFGQQTLPRRPAPPRLVSASPLSVRLIF